jgi:hypothetical protein
MIIVMMMIMTINQSRYFRQTDVCEFEKLCVRTMRFDGTKHGVKKKQ